MYPDDGSPSGVLQNRNILVGTIRVAQIRSKLTACTPSVPDELKKLYDWQCPGLFEKESRLSRLVYTSRTTHTTQYHDRPQARTTRKETR